MAERDIEKRTFAFALRLVRIAKTLQEDRTDRILGTQVLRSGTSIGANVEEAQGAQNKADFIAKMCIARKEARETIYWLRLIRESRLLAADKMDGLITEAEEIAKVVSAIIVSSPRKA